MFALTKNGKLVKNLTVKAGSTNTCFNDQGVGDY